MKISRKICMGIRSEKGFTLLETLISVALISIIVVGILMGLATASRVLLGSDNL
jgi:prepilin-type N-terminal cleavage/methylation domain-containing protein